MEMKEPRPAIRKDLAPGLVGDCCLFNTPSVAANREHQEKAI